MHRLHVSAGCAALAAAARRAAVTLMVPAILAASAAGAVAQDSASRITPGIGPTGVGSGLPPVVTSRGSGAGSALPAIGFGDDAGPDEIIVDRRQRTPRVRR